MEVDALDGRLNVHRSSVPLSFHGSRGSILRGSPVNFRWNHPGFHVEVVSRSKIVWEIPNTVCVESMAPGVGASGVGASPLPPNTSTLSAPR